MARHSYGSPPPPQDFAGREIPVETIPAGALLARIHHGEFDPLHFGSKTLNRFSDRRRIHGVRYLAKALEGAFAETIVRGANDGGIQQSYVQERSYSKIQATGPLRLASLHGPGLARVGATSAVSSGSYDVARIWSRAIHDHPAVLDSIAYRSKHDDDEICIVLFDRARERVAPAGVPEPMIRHPNLDATYLNPVSQVLPGTEAVRRPASGSFRDTRLPFG